MPEFPMRYIEVKGKRYLREQDVAEYLLTLAQTEPTDTRKRLEEAAAKFKEKSNA